APHGPFPPQWQAPKLHWLVVNGSQALHTPPPLPHAPGELGLQLPPAQQPCGHEAPSHTQPPLAQRWPAAHCALAPHSHAPAAEERGAAKGALTAAADARAAVAHTIARGAVLAGGAGGVAAALAAARGRAVIALVAERAVDAQRAGRAAHGVGDDGGAAARVA